MSEYDRLKKQYDALVDKEKVRERRMYDALKQISMFQSVRQIKETSEALYGMPYSEAIEMAYENILEIAKAAVGDSK